METVELLPVAAVLDRLPPEALARVPDPIRSGVLELA